MVSTFARSLYVGMKIRMRSFSSATTFIASLRDAAHGQ